jgi:hypothetical protein
MSIADAKNIEGDVRGAAVAPIVQQHAITVGGNRLGQIDQFGIGPAAAGRQGDEWAVGTDDFVVDVNAAGWSGDSREGRMMKWGRLAIALPASSQR